MMHPLLYVTKFLLSQAKALWYPKVFVSLSLNKKNEGMKIYCYFPYDVNTLIDEESASGYGVYWTNTIRKGMTNGCFSQRGGRFFM